jgi:hypothetical protein
VLIIGGGLVVLFLRLLLMLTLLQASAASSSGSTRTEAVRTVPISIWGNYGARGVILRLRQQMIYINRVCMSHGRIGTELLLHIYTAC